MNYKVLLCVRDCFSRNVPLQNFSKTFLQGKIIDKQGFQFFLQFLHLSLVSPFKSIILTVVYAFDVLCFCNTCQLSLTDGHLYFPH